MHKINNMIKLIVKYIIIHVAALLIANLIGLLIHDFIGYDYFENTMVIIWGPRLVNYSIRAIISFIVYRDMRRISNKVNIWILILIWINDYYGTSFFLLSAFFQDYKSINTVKNAKTN